MKTVEYIKNPSLESFMPLRRQLSTIAIEAIKEKPLLGYGISRTQENLNSRYRKYNMDHAANYNFHSHNQYLQNSLYGGIGFGLAFVIIYVASLFYMKRKLLWSVIFIIFNLAFLTDAPLTNEWILIDFIFLYTLAIIEILNR